MKIAAIQAIALFSVLSGCADDGVSTAQVERAAEQRAREKFGLAADARLKTAVFVGRPRDGDLILCGTVEGTRADGSAIPMQRFIASTDPFRWLLFGETDSPGRVTMPSMFPDWALLCGDARGR